MTADRDSGDKRMLAEKYRPFINLINNDPLIEAGPTLEMISLQTIDSNSSGSIYYGTGLTTPRAIGIGLPFDVLGMILVAERIKKAIGLKKIFHHIADTHAKTNDWIDKSEVDKKAEIVSNTLNRVSQNLKIDGFNVLLSSSFDNSDEYQKLLSDFTQSTDKHEYVAREMADMEWYRKKHNTVIKMGWIIQSSETEIGFDERLFDREYIKIKGNQLSFVYTKPGRTMDKSRPKASPYIQIEGEQRILLVKGENVKVKLANARATFGDQHLGGAMKHLESIVRDYEKLFGSLGKDLLDNKIQQIIDKVTK